MGQGVGASPSNFWTRGIKKESLYPALSRALRSVSLKKDAPRLRLAVVELGRGVLPDDPRASVLLFPYKRENYSHLNEKDFALMNQVVQVHQRALRAEGLLRFYELEAALFWLRSSRPERAQPYMLSLAQSQRSQFAVKGLLLLAIDRLMRNGVTIETPFLDLACNSTRLPDDGDSLKDVFSLPDRAIPLGLQLNRVQRGRCALVRLLNLEAMRGRHPAHRANAPARPTSAPPTPGRGTAP